jgi:hypothetical protein
MKCKNCGEEIEAICYHGHTWRHVDTCLFMCFKDRKPRRGQKNYFEAEPEEEKDKPIYLSSTSDAFVKGCSTPFWS